MDKYSWLIDLLFVLFSLIFVILGSTCYVNYKFNPNTIKEYKQNWNLGPIIDIKEISLAENCPEKYSSFFTNYFPGNIEGCDCRNTNRKPAKKSFYTQPCSLNKIADKCLSIKKNDKIFLDIWKGKKLCIKRMEKNFWELEIISEKNQGEKISKESFIQLRKTIKKKLNIKKSEEACTNANHKVCGYLDENKNPLCLDKNLECPINDLIFSKKSTFEKRDDKNLYKSISLNDEEALYYTNKNTKGDIIIELFALLGNRCIIPDEGKLGENEYPLNNLKGEMYCKTKIENIDHDFRYKVIDQYSQGKFYDDNKITERIKKLKGYMQKDEKTGKYLYYQTGKDETIKIFYSKYMGWNKNCAKLNSKDNFLDELLDPSKTDVESSKGKLYFFCFLTGFNMILQFFFYFVLKILLYKNKMNFLGVAGFDFYIFSISVFIFVYIIIIYGLTNNLVHPSYIFSKFKCGDETTSKVMNFTFDSIMDIFPKLITIIVLAGGQILFFFIFYGLNYKKFFNSSYKNNDDRNRGLTEMN